MNPKAETQGKADILWAPACLVLLADVRTGETLGSASRQGWRAEDRSPREVRTEAHGQGTVLRRS